MFTTLKCGKGALQNKRFLKRLPLTPFLTNEMAFCSNTLHTSKKAEILTLHFFIFFYAVAISCSLFFVLNFDFC